MNFNAVKNTQAWVRFTFLLMAACIAFALVNRGLSLKLFNLAAVVSLACGLCALRAQPRASVPGWLLALLVTVLLLGASKWLWAYAFGIADEDHANNNDAGGERIFTGAVIAAVLYSQRHAVGPTTRKWAGGLLFAGLLFIFGRGMSEYAVAGQRIKLNTDAATTAAYIITAYGLTTAIVVRQAFTRAWLSMALFLGSAVVTLALLALTDTRSAIMLAPLLFMVLCVAEFGRLPRAAKAIACITLLLASAVAASMAWERLSAMQGEVEQYAVNNNSSIGARLSLINAGLHAQPFTWLGQTVDERYTHLQAYITEYEHSNPVALFSIQYHLHNEFLDTLTLRGIVPAAILIAFYLALLLAAVRTRNIGLWVFALVLLVFGQTDVVLYQRLACLAIFACLPVILALLPVNERHAAPRV